MIIISFQFHEQKNILDDFYAFQAIDYIFYPL